MSNTDFLRSSEADLLPEGFIQGHVFQLEVDGYHGIAEVDGWHPGLREAVEICQSDTDGTTPKPGQKRKLASDVLKLVFLMNRELIVRGRVILTSTEMYTWFHQSGSWLGAACRAYGIGVELRKQERKNVRKRIRNVMRAAKREMRSDH